MNTNRSAAGGILVALVAAAACNTSVNGGSDGKQLAVHVGSGSGAAAGSGAASGDAGAPISCDVPADCPPTGSFCLLKACVGGKCGVAAAPEGDVLPTQTAGDCQQLVCDADGGTISIPDDTDVPVSTNPCVIGMCNDGVPDMVPAAISTPCSASGGIACDGMGSCVQCITSADCPMETPVCTTAHSCSGTLLASQQGQAGEIAVDATTVYWTSLGAPGAVMKCAIGGCGDSPTLVASGQMQPGSIAVDANYVYWTTAGTGNGDGAVMKCAVGGCDDNPIVLASGQDSPQAIAIDATYVYWTTNAPDGIVMKVPLEGGTPTSLASGPGAPSAIAVDATSVYWVMYTEGTVTKVPIGGGTPTLLASGQFGLEGIAVDATNVYWTSESDGMTAGTGSVTKVPIGGGASTSLASALYFPMRVAVDATDVYWTNASYFGAGSVMKCAAGGCGGHPTTLAWVGGNARGIAVDATNIYWTDQDVGMVVQLAK